MKKITSGIAGLFAVVALVAGIGYALFSDQVSVTGMVLGTASPNLLISMDNNYYNQSIGVGDVFRKLLPGKQDWGEIWLKNTSTANGGHPGYLNMNLTGRITAAAGDWYTLKDAIQMRVCKYSGDGDVRCDTGAATPWYTLSQWNTYNITLPGPLAESTTPQHYAINFQIDQSYGNEIAGKLITGMTLEVTGTQVP